MTDTLAREMLKQKAKARKDPEFAAAEQELTHKLTWATMMRDAGRLTKKEFQEFESHLTAAYLDAMPVETFVEMQKDGRYSDLETIARRIDDKSDSYDVLAARKKLEAKITRDALDEAFAAQKIDSKRYLEESRNFISDDDKVRRFNDTDENADGDAVALDEFFSRNLPEDDKAPIEPTSDPDRIKSADED